MWQIEYRVSNLVSSHRGTLPVLIACPHGGDAIPAGVTADRTGQGLPPNCDFEDSRDLFTRELARGIAQRMVELFGEAPYVVIADFDRKRIDANRRRECAFEMAAAAPFYDEYHATLRAFVDEIRADNGGLGLLFDIHGTAGIAGDPGEIFLGTADGQTLARLLQADPLAPFRRRSLRGYLQAAGLAVSPPQPGPEVPKLSGGFSVRTYGSSNADGLDAMQLEIITPQRTDPDKRQALSEVLAHAFGNLAARWADARTLSAADRIDLLDGGQVQASIGEWQRRSDSRDARLRVGGRASSRGRVDIRHDPAARSRAGVLVLYDERGKDYFVWVDTQGTLRISPTDPGSTDLAGAPVGGQV
jgi:N-formylglutamate amidohydrolase